MSEMITSYIGQMSAGFFVRQLIVILLLFMLGLCVNACACGGRMSLIHMLLAYPVGISVYSLTGFILLVMELPFNRGSVTGICAAIAAVCGILALICSRKAEGPGMTLKERIIAIITVLCIAVISTSGILSVSASNDSLYYYWMYPRALVKYGYYKLQFDVFLTDIGQTSATLNTLPFMYGFNEAFGIQTFLGINTVFITAYAMYDKAMAVLDKKKAALTTAVLSALLICTQPFIIMLKWAMSNGYFMCFMFITVYAVKAFEKGAGEKDDDVDGSLLITGILLLQMSMLRMEGIMVALTLVICFSMLGYENKDLFTVFLFPEFLCALAYAGRVFYIGDVDAPYTFLTPKKAVIQLAAIVLVSVYVLVFRGRKFDIAGKHLKVLLPLGLAAVNGVLFMLNKTLYIKNCIAFLKNISNRSGWGLFPMILIASYILVAIVTCRDRDQKFKMTYWDMCFVSYLLATLAVCFAREDALRESIGDSGNRVLMQVTLLAFFAAADHLIKLVDRDR